MSTPQFKGATALAASALVLGAASAASAYQAPVFDQQLSNISMTHSPDFRNTAIAPFSINVNPPPPNLPGNYQLNHTFHNTGSNGLSSSSVAFGAVSEFTDPLNTSLQFKSGSGVTQTNAPGEAYASPAALRIGVNSDWQLPSGFPQFGLEPVLFYSFPVGGVVGIGGVDRFIVNLSVVSVQGASSTFLGSIAVNKVYQNTTGAPLPFTDPTVTGSTVLNNGNPLPAGSELLITGEIDFRAKNDESPSTTELVGNGIFGVQGRQVHAVPLPAGWATTLAGLAAVTVGQWARSRRPALA